MSLESFCLTFGARFACKLYRYSSYIHMDNKKEDHTLYDYHSNQS